MLIRRTPRIVNMLLNVYSKCSLMPTVDDVIKLYDDLNLPMNKYSFGFLLTSSYRSRSSVAVTRRILTEMSKR